MKLLVVLAAVFSMTTQAKADAKQEAFDCLDKSAAAYALVSCELAETIVNAARGACGTQIHELTRAVVRDERYAPLTLNQKLDIADRLIAARSNRLTALVLESRVRANKSC